MDNKINFKKNPSDNSHYRQLRKLIKNVTTDLPKSRIFYKRIMTVILPLTFLLSYLLALSYRDYMLLYFILFAVLGIISVLIFINVIHDAVHDNIFKKQWANNALILLFDHIGGNSYIWKQRHMVLHHNYQNISGWDSDIEQAGLIKIYPQGKKLKINNYQHWFIFFFYPLYLFNWILIRDFNDFFLK